MSAQFFDRLKYNEQDYGLAATPLSTYFSLHPEQRPVFASFNTACMRGYVADWEIRENALYLTGVEMVCKTESSFSSLFPNPPDGGVFAEWVSGVFRCVSGKLMRYEHAGFASVYEHEVSFTIEKGQVLDVKSAAGHKPPA